MKGNAMQTKPRVVKARLTLAAAHRLARRLSGGRCGVTRSDVDLRLWEFELDGRYIEVHEPMSRDRLVAFVREWCK